MADEAPQNRERPVEDSVERTLSVIRDRWTFLVLREAFFGVRRFTEIADNTGVSPAVLTDRLKSLVADGILRTVPYGNHPNRHEYRLTEKGRDLYPLIVLLMQWGDRWLTDGEAPLQLVHECGTPNPFELSCHGCGEPVQARTTTWRPAQEG